MALSQIIRWGLQRKTHTVDLWTLHMSTYVCTHMHIYVYVYTCTTHLHIHTENHKYSHKSSCFWLCTGTLPSQWIFFVWYTLYCGESALQFLSFQGRIERNSQHDSIEHTKLTCMFYLIHKERTCDTAVWICIYYINYEVHSGIW